MTDKKLSQLPAGTAIASTDLFYSAQDIGGGNFTQVKQPASALTTFLGSGGGRTEVTATLDYYVRTDGSDSNTGLANTAGGAFLTIQHAVNYVAENLHMRPEYIFTPTYININVADGTYSTANGILLPTLDAVDSSVGNVNIIGNTTTPSNVVINKTGALGPCVACYGGTWNIYGVKFEASGAAAATINLVLVYGDTLLWMAHCVFGKAGTAGTGSHIMVLRGSVNVQDVMITGIANTFVFIKGEVEGTAKLHFQHDDLNMTIDPLWPGGTLAISRFAEVYWSPDGIITGTSSGPKVVLDQFGRLLLGGALSSIPGTGITNSGGIIDFGFPGEFAYTAGTGLRIGETGTGTGKILLKGTTSGTVTVSTQDAAGTWTLKLPTTDGGTNEFLQTDGSGNTTWATPGAGSGSPGGSSPQVQYNNSGVFDGAANFTISSGNPNVASGGAYLYNSVNAIRAVTADNNWWFADAGNLTATGTANVGMGGSALAADTSGARNVAIGPLAMQVNTSGSDNVALGNQALAAVVSNTANTAIGPGAMFGATGSRNFAMGQNALGTNTASDNIGIGGATLYAATAGENIAIGGSTLTANTSGSKNIAIGSGIASAVTTGSFNVAIGAATFVSLTTSSNNVAIGYFAASAATGGSNICIGLSAGALLSSGSANLIITPNNSFNSQVTSGSNNILIGARSNIIQTITANNQLNIGNYIYGTGLDGDGSTLSAGKIGIGVTAPVCALDVAGSVKTQAVAVGSLPTAGNKGARNFVTDSNATLVAGLGNVVAAGGSNNVPVYDDGTNWRIG